MNAQNAAALFLVFVVSTPEICSYGGVLSPWILGLLVLLAGYLQRRLESTDALKGALRGLLLTAIGLGTAQWFAPLGWLGVGTGLSLIALSRYVRQRSILKSFLLASFGLAVCISLGLFSMKPAWLFMSSTDMHLGSFGLLVAFAALIGVFCDAKISALKHGVYALGVASLSALMNSAFYEHGEGTATHLVVILAVGFGVALTVYFSSTGVRNRYPDDFLLFASFVAGSVAYDSLYPFWWTGLFPALSGYCLLRQAMRQWSHFGNVLARASGIVFGLAAVNATDSPSASESIALALVAVACVIVVERSFQEHAP